MFKFVQMTAAHSNAVLVAKALANAKKYTITKITPYYSEGVYGESANEQ